MENAMVGVKAPRQRQKLTEEQAREILVSTESQTALAKRFGIHQPHVSDIKSGRRWAWLQPTKTYTPDPRPVKNPDLVTDAQIRKYDPMIKMMINDHVLRYWACGNSCATLDPRASIGRLGKSVEDLIQDGRIFVLQQIRWLQRNRRRGKGCAKESTLVYMQLKRKFISLSRSFAAARHGGQVVSVDDNRKAIENLINTIPDDMPIDESVHALKDALGEMNKDLQKSLLSKVMNDAGHVKISTSDQLTSILENRLKDMNVLTHVSLDTMDPDRRELAIDTMTPEASAIVREYLEQLGPEEIDELMREDVPRRNMQRSSRFKIFVLAKQLGLPSTHGALAVYLGRSPSALSNILHNQSNGTREFRAKLEQVFGVPLDELRKVVDQAA